MAAEISAALSFVAGVVDSWRLHRCNPMMTKAENRAAAKAWHQEQPQKMREEVRAQAVAADLEQLRHLRLHLIKKAGVPAMDLTNAIDDCVEKLTGDRTKLHTPRHSIGGG